MCLPQSLAEVDQESERGKYLTVAISYNYPHELTVEFRMIENANVRLMNAVCMGNVVLISTLKKQLLFIFCPGLVI